MGLNGNPTSFSRTLGLFAALCLLLTGCQRLSREPSEPKPSPVPYEFAEPLPADARRFEVAPDRSLITILVYRAGALASAGHNHVVASHEVRGAIAFTPDVSRSQFTLRMPVDTLTVDEPELRREAGAEFAAAIPPSAQDATRRNLLGAAVLDAERFPEVLVQAVGIEPAAGGALATVRITLRGETRAISVPCRYEQKGEELLADGEFRLLQSAFGITPFTTLLGAMRVQDEITVRFRILARASARQALQGACPHDIPCSRPPA
jgi:polyisoprenoid-binding protein YceI